MSLLSILTITQKMVDQYYIYINFYIIVVACLLGEEGKISDVPISPCVSPPVYTANVLHG